MGPNETPETLFFLGFAEPMADFDHGHERRRKPPPANDRVRSYLRGLIKTKGVELKDLSKYCGKNQSYFSSYFRGEPQELPEDVREKLAEFFKLDNPAVFRADAADVHGAQAAFGYRFLHRLGVDAAPVPEHEQFPYPAPPLWNGPRRGFLAQVVDDHADRLCPVGSVLWACDRAQLGRPLRAGDRCVVRIDAGRAGGGGRDEPTDQHRLMLVSLSADGHDILIQSSTSRRQMAAAFTLSRPSPAGTPDAIDYRPEPDDGLVILGVVVATLPPLQ